MSLAVLVMVLSTLFLTACENSTPKSSTFLSSGGSSSELVFSFPDKLKNRVLPSGGVLSAHILVDGSVRHELSVSTTTSQAVSGSFSSSLGSHTFQIVFEYTDSSGTPIQIVTASKNISVASGSNNLAFSSADYQFTDSDGDGVGNLAELIAATDPNDAASVPQITSPTTTAAPLAGSYTTAQTVTLSCNDTGLGCDKIYYTVDGSTPTASSSVYTAPLTVSSTTTLSYFSTNLAGYQEAVQSQVYVVGTSADYSAPTTTAAPLAGSYTATQTVTLSCNDTGAGCITTYYTVDGSTPTASSPIYTTPLTVSSTTTLSYFSTDWAGNQEAVQSQVYVVTPATTSITVTLTVAAKELRFSWNAVLGAHHYRILENPDGISGFTVIANNIALTEYVLPISVHQLDWSAAQYQVESCDAAEINCTSSNSQPLSLANSIAATVYLKAFNSGAGDGFSRALSLSGDGNTLAVGAPLEQSSATGINSTVLDNNVTAAGAVYVFTRDSVTQHWSQQAYVKASNTGANDWFGVSVSLSHNGNILAVGADGSQGAGAAYLFVRDINNNWSQKDNLQGSNTVAGDQFGHSVDLSSDGNTLVVSAPREDGIAVDSGAVYLFTRGISAVWSEQAYLKASNAGNNDWFGEIVRLSGDGATLAVGAPKENSAEIGIGGTGLGNSALDAGAVYLFTRNLSNVWIQQEYIKASNAAAFDLFGSSMSLSFDGNTLAVSALGEDSAATGINGNQADNVARGSGAVYLFNRSTNVWSQHAYIKASNTDSRDEFGFSLSLSSDGNTLAVGSYGDDSIAKGINGNQFDNSAVALEGSSSAYLLKRDLSGVWSHNVYIKSSNTELSDLFGFSISLSADGKTLAVGAHQEDSAALGVGGNQSDNTALNSGAVYLY